MNCPKCGFSQNEGSVECAKCGIIFSKWKANAMAGKPADRMVPAMASGSMRSAGAGSMAAAITPQSQNVSLFGAICCPHCGGETTTQANASTGKWGGIAEIMISYALTAQYQCGEHGIIDSTQFSSEVQRVIMLRKMLTIASAVGIFILAVWILMKFD